MTSSNSLAPNEQQRNHASASAGPPRVELPLRPHGATEGTTSGNTLASSHSFGNSRDEPSWRMLLCWQLSTTGQAALTAPVFALHLRPPCSTGIPADRAVSGPADSRSAARSPPSKTAAGTGSRVLSMESVPGVAGFSGLPAGVDHGLGTGTR